LPLPAFAFLKMAQKARSSERAFVIAFRCESASSPTGGGMMRSAVARAMAIFLDVADDPCAEDIGEFQVVVVHHHHVTVALNAEVREQQELRIAARLLE
jgi:hypothetical protein